MNELSVGLWLRRERERRNITLQHIANQTKVAVPLLEGLEAGDLGRWPGGIYRRAFVKSYAVALGLDADEVLRRVEAEHPPEPDEPSPLPAVVTPQPSTAGRAGSVATASNRPRASSRARVLGTAADLTVALVLGMGSAAAGSRLLWPVLFIAFYYAAGILLTGTSPMVALLSEDPEPRPGPVREPPAPSAQAPAPEEIRASQRPTPERRPASRRVSRAQRASKARHHLQ